MSTGFIRLCHHRSIRLQRSDLSAQEIDDGQKLVSVTLVRILGDILPVSAINYLPGSLLDCRIIAGIGSAL